ncbi:MAG: hypothetical protein ACXVGC_00165 [Mycobacteriaceae bacterium]
MGENDMSAAFFKPTDLGAPGAIEDLLAFHRARFGDARMEEGTGGEGGNEGEGGDGAAKVKAAGATSTSDKGFPENTPVDEMTPAQREAYWKHQSRKHEDRVKAFGNITPEALKALQEKASKHDELERELMSDKDKAIAEARDAAAAAAIPRVVKAEFKAAAKGVLSNDQLNALLEDRDLTKYADANGEPDEDKIAKLVTAFAPAKTTRTGPSATGLGNRTGGGDAPGAQGRAMAEKRFGKK